MIPFSANVNFSNGEVKQYHNKSITKLNEIKSFFYDNEAAEDILRNDNRVIYEAYEVRTPEEAGNLSWCTTIIYPGCVGKEYHMTKGHFHSKEGSSEIYIGLRGTGNLVIQTYENQFEVLQITPESVHLVPPYWAHRVVNVGKEKLIILAIYASDAGHDYSVIGEKGFRKLVLQENNSTVFVDNSKYK